MSGDRHKDGPKHPGPQVCSGRGMASDCQRFRLRGLRGGRSQGRGRHRSRRPGATGCRRGAPGDGGGFRWRRRKNLGFAKRVRSSSDGTNQGHLAGLPIGLRVCGRDDGRGPGDDPGGGDGRTPRKAEGRVSAEAGPGEPGAASTEGGGRRGFHQGDRRGRQSGEPRRARRCSPQG